MLKIIVLQFCLFVFFLPENYGQEFEKAPLPNVKTITEWVQVGKSKKAKKGMVYHFNKKGLLTNFERKGENGFEGENGKFKYDKRNRIKSKNTKYGINKTIMTYAYKKKYYVEEVEYKDSYYKIFYYVDKNLNIIERKSFAKNLDSKFKLQLFERTVYDYNKNKKLQSTRHFNHMNLRNKNAKPIIQESYYKYSKLGKVLECKEFDAQKKLNILTSYKYDKKGNLVKKTLDRLNGEKEITTYTYKNGKLLTEEFNEGNVVITKIYKKNRLIRKRKKWQGGRAEIIDFQYSFYK